jgi:hypothetical protein
LKIARVSTLKHVAFVVCTALEEAGVTAVLTGGSAATVYAPHALQSLDLDFIVTFHAENANADDALAAIGYRRGRQHYEHAENRLILEFPSGPLAVGGELIHEWDTMHERGLRLHIIKPTDSCRDRLAGFLFWRDRGSLEQAIAVASAQRRRVDLNRVRRWCAAEGHADDFEEFARGLK